MSLRLADLRQEAQRSATSVAEAVGAEFAARDAELQEHNAKLAARDVLLQERDAAVAKVNNMVRKLTQLAIVGIHSDELAPEKEATATLWDSVDQVPDEGVAVHPDQPGKGATQVGVNIALGGWRGDDFVHYKVNEVAPEAEGATAREVETVAVWGFWELTNPLTHNGKADYMHEDTDAEFFGVVSGKMRGIMTMEISAPPTEHQRDAVSKLVKLVTDQEVAFGDAWETIEQLRNGGSDTALAAGETEAAADAPAPVVFQGAPLA